jgi:hypothetical protein
MWVLVILMARRFWRFFLPGAAWIFGAAGGADEALNSSENREI